MRWCQERHLGGTIRIVSRGTSEKVSRKTFELALRKGTEDDLGEISELRSKKKCETISQVKV